MRGLKSIADISILELPREWQVPGPVAVEMPAGGIDH